MSHARRRTTWPSSGKAFGADLVRIDKTIDGYLKKLAKDKHYDRMPFYAATYEQTLPTGLLKRAAMVSRSPQMIQQWVEKTSNPMGAQPIWQALPYDTFGQAYLVAQQWMNPADRLCRPPSKTGCRSLSCYGPSAYRGRLNVGDVAQLERPGLQPGGWRFDPARLHFHPPFVIPFHPAFSIVDLATCGESGVLHLGRRA